MQHKSFAFLFAFFAFFAVDIEAETKKERQAKGEKSLPPEKEGELESFIISEEPGGFLTPTDVAAQLKA